MGDRPYRRMRTDLFGHFSFLTWTAYPNTPNRLRNQSLGLLGMPTFSPWQKNSRWKKKKWLTMMCFSVPTDRRHGFLGQWTVRAAGARGRASSDTATCLTAKHRPSFRMGLQQGGHRGIWHTRPEARAGPFSWGPVLMGSPLWVPTPAGGADSGSHQPPSALRTQGRRA
jgi:hypothetical protein